MAHQLNVRLPASLRDHAKTAAKEQGVSVNQFCALAIARAVGEAQARHFFEKRRAGLSVEEGRRKLSSVLNKVKK